MSVADREELANRIWNLCNVLRDDGVVYHKYLSELTYLLFLKNAKQLGVEESLPADCRWDSLLAARTTGILSHYRKMLTQLGEDSRSGIVRQIFVFPTTVVSHDENLSRIVDGIEAIDWHLQDRDALGEIYESLLERNANEARSGSGQYFTPRPLVNAMVSVMQPDASDVVLDPAVGTGGFLIAAHNAASVSKNAPMLYQGVEIERETFRLALMNLFLHEMEGHVVHGDALSSDSSNLVPASLVLANPPFGVSSGGARQRREDLPFRNSNKQLAFLQYISIALAPGGRAAVVVPDNVLADRGVGQKIREQLVEKFHLHTILRLPSGIFYAAGVQTNVLFFNRPLDEESAAVGVWTYDMRTATPTFTKRRPLSDSDFDEFIAAYGDDPRGQSPRIASSNFSYTALDELRSREYDLDLRPGLHQDNATPEDVLSLLAEMTAAVEHANRLFGELDGLLGGSRGTDSTALYER